MQLELFMYAAWRLQVPVVPPAQELCLLRDVLDLQLPGHPSPRGPSHTPPDGPKLQLHADLSAPDRWYAVQPNGVHTLHAVPELLCNELLMCYAEQSPLQGCILTAPVAHCLHL